MNDEKCACAKGYNRALENCNYDVYEKLGGEDERLVSFKSRMPYPVCSGIKHRIV